MFVPGLRGLGFLQAYGRGRAGGEGHCNAVYAEAAALVSRMAALRSAADQATYVAALKARFGRKRNFMKLLG